MPNEHTSPYLPCKQQQRIAGVNSRPGFR